MTRMTFEIDEIFKRNQLGSNTVPVVKAPKQLEEENIFHPLGKTSAEKNVFKRALLR